MKAFVRHGEWPASTDATTSRRSALVRKARPRRFARTPLDLPKPGGSATRTPLWRPGRPLGTSPSDTEHLSMQRASTRSGAAGQALDDVDARSLRDARSGRSAQGPTVGSPPRRGSSDLSFLLQGRIVTAPRSSSSHPASRSSVPRATRQWKRSTVRRRSAFVPLPLLRLSAQTHRCRATVAGRGPRPTLRFFNSACPPSLSPLPARLCAPTRACDLCGNFVTSLLVACGVGLGRSSSTSPERELLIDEQLSQ